MASPTFRALGALAAVSLAHAALAAQPALLQPARHDLATWTFHHENVLGTSLQLTIQAATRAQAEQAEAAALATFDRSTAILSAWSPHSEFSRWAATRFAAIPVSPELFDVLLHFDYWRDRTAGALDASAAAATRLWQAAAAAGRTPTEAEIAETRAAIAQPHWSLDPALHTATRLTDVPLALASFTKSYITAKAADQAMQAGATGIVLNVGGDIVVRGNLTQLVAIANPAASADNDAPLDHVLLHNMAIATSGSYRRGFTPTASSPATAPHFSHLIDPRTAMPAAHILSSTVIAPNAATAGALATAFSILPAAESRRLAQALPGIDYLIIPRDGAPIESPGWSTYQTARIRPASYLPATPVPAGAWNQQFELAIALQLPPAPDARYRRPYVAVWVEDADHFPVRTLALWSQKPRWLPELKQWYRDDQVRTLADGTDLSKTIASATRPPGAYTLKWDGKDDQGKLVKAGKYTLCVESSREHGGYQLERRTLDFDAQPQQAQIPAGNELGPITLDYRKR